MIQEFSIALDLASLTAAAEEAGALAMRWFHAGAATSARVDHKAGGSPVTEADFAVEAFMEERLRDLYPDFGWLSEEGPDNEERLQRQFTLILDPIDGTRAFTQGDPQWAVCIAVARDGEPVAGVIHAPALKETFVAETGKGAYLNGARLDIRARAAIGPPVAGPEPFTAKVCHILGCAAAPKTPSLALRFAYVAKGGWTGALAKKNARDWDIAAADIILREAGGGICNLKGDAPRYNTPRAAHDLLCAAPDLLMRPLVTAARRASSSS